MSMPQPTDHAAEALLEYLKENRGVDFTGYKRSTLMRRIRKRVQVVGVESYEEYVDYLEVHPDELTLLFNTILINVTSFFRDPSAWEYLADVILPRILAGKRPNDPIRVWSAGCASGEEAYSVAMLLAEALGEEGFRERVKVYATDVDEDALAQARQATYGVKEVAPIPPDLLRKYFEPAHHLQVFRRELRRSVIFGRHDLVQDAPISRIDLLICRNTLMYFNGETQARILARFHFALNDGGFLFLGKAEMLLVHANLFTPVDLKRRIFTRVQKMNLRDRLLVMAHTGSEETANHLARLVRLREAAFTACPAAQVVVDLNGLLAQVNEQARRFFGLSARDAGRPTQELELFSHLMTLRAAVDQATIHRRPVALQEVEWVGPSGDLYYLNVQAAPLLDASGALLGVSLAFVDVTSYKQLREQVEHTNQELETAYEELQSTNEELETSNEELQSTTEELETTNEELQSTNEELETMNEELQSTNEELETMNEELRRRTDEVTQINTFLESILTSMQAGVVVVDRDLHIQVWNLRAEDLWGLRTDEVNGQHFLNLDTGLRVEQLKQPIRACLAGELECQEMVLEATTRRGKAIHCKVTCMPLFGAQGDIRGTILLMEEVIDPKE